jgi:Uma2 family endonuclease
VNAPIVPKVRMKVDEFLAWSDSQSEGRYELVDGQIVAMAPDRVLHNLTKLSVAVALRDAVNAAALPCTVFTDGVAVVINESTTRIPDASVQCEAPLDRASMVVSPLIVVEVASPSSERSDLGAKLIEYFSLPGVRHYLVVLADKRAVVHYRRHESGEIETHILHEGADVILAPPGMNVRVSALLGPELPAEGSEDD